MRDMGLPFLVEQLVGEKMYGNEPVLDGAMKLPPYYVQYQLEFLVLNHRLLRED